MGFKVTVHKNGAKHGEMHYSSEAVAMGMASKMKNAGAEASVARCNGTGCGCMNANPRRRRNGTTGSEEAYWEGVLADLARLAKEEKEASKARARRSYSPHTKEEMARIVALDMDAPRRRNGTTSANLAASRSMTRQFRR
jgi:hypothetical protein